MAGVKMLAYKPANPRKRPTHHQKIHVPHTSQNYNEPCFYCGQPGEQWKQYRNCPAFLDVMGLLLPAEA